MRFHGVYCFLSLPFVAFRCPSFLCLSLRCVSTVFTVFFLCLSLCVSRCSLHFFSACPCIFTVFSTFFRPDTSTAINGTEEIMQPCPVSPTCPPFAIGVTACRAKETTEPRLTHLRAISLIARAQVVQTLLSAFPAAGCRRIACHHQWRGGGGGGGDKRWEPSLPVLSFCCTPLTLWQGFQSDPREGVSGITVPGWY